MCRSPDVGESRPSVGIRLGLSVTSAVGGAELSRGAGMTSPLDRAHQGAYLTSGMACRSASPGGLSSESSEHIFRLCACRLARASSSNLRTYRGFCSQPKIWLAPDSPATCLLTSHLISCVQSHTHTSGDSNIKVVLFGPWCLSSARPTFALCLRPKSTLLPTLCKWICPLQIFPLPCWHQLMPGRQACP